MRSSTFRRYLINVQDELFEFACELTGNQEDKAYELLQETSLRALKNEDKYRFNFNFKNWMRVIMRNIFFGNNQKLEQERDLFVYAEGESLYEIPHENAYERMELECDLKEVYRIINTLPNTYRIPFSMYLVGLKYEEIALKMEIPVGTVKSRIFSTRQKLKRILTHSIQN